MGRPRKNLAPDFLRDPRAALMDPRFWSCRTVHDLCEAIGVVGGDQPARALELSRDAVTLALRTRRYLLFVTGAETFRRAHKALNNPDRALDRAEADVVKAKKEGLCALVDALGAHGTALRRMNRLDEAAQQFALALRLCRCPACLARIRRRQTYLSICAGNPRAAMRQVRQALAACRDMGDQAMEGRVLLARASVYHEFGQSARALADVRAALALIPHADEHYILAGLQNLACYLASTENDEDWREALEVISRTLTAIGKVPGLQVLKIRLRWAKVLALRQLGETSERALQARMAGVCEDLFALGLDRDALDAAASASDLALLGAPPPMVIWAASSALALQVDQKGPVAEALASLQRAGESESSGIDAAARAVRQACPQALALPGCLRAA